jgi:hypothetical protein
VKKMIDDALREQVGHYLHDIHWVPSCVGQIERVNYNSHPAAAHWQQVVSVLRQDPGATLP